MSLPDKIFFTGVPGSRWSGIAAWIEENVPGMNTSDRSDDRYFEHPKPTQDNPLPANHNGSYFGTGMEYTLDLTDENLNAPYDNLDGCKIIKSHEWAHKLDEIKENFPDDWICLVYRPDDVSLQWWLEIGGFTIDYPNYSHYQDDIGMRQAIREQNHAILKFASKHKAVWHHINPNFMKEYFGVTVEPVNEMYYDVLIAIVKRDTTFHFNK